MPPVAAADATAELLKQGILGIVIFGLVFALVYVWRQWMAERAGFNAERNALLVQCANEKAALLAQLNTVHAELTADAKAYGVLAQQLTAQCAAAMNGTTASSESVADALDRIERLLRRDDPLRDERKRTPLR